MLAVALASPGTTAHAADLPAGARASASEAGGLVSVALSIGSRWDAFAPLLGPAVPVPLVKPVVRRQPPREAICRMIEVAAREHEIPVKFLTRLIWQESRFRIGAVSHAGARGIAQFMPATAAERRLHDPFDPRLALGAAASLLRSLQQRFGNIGLAAAAYNAGPGRVADWLGRKGLLPEETRNYVQAVTGRPARSWMEPAGKGNLGVIAADGADDGCVATVVAMAENG